MRRMLLLFSALAVVGVVFAVALAIASGGGASRVGGRSGPGAKAPAGVAPGARGDPSSAGGVRAMRALEARWRWLAGPAARAQRVRSRMAFHGLSATPSQGLLAHDFARELHTAAVNPTHAGVLADRQVRYLSAYKAMIRGPRGPRFVYSSVPLLAGPPGRRRPVDLALSATAGGFAPRNPVRDVSISRTLAGGVGLWSSGLRVYVGGRDVTGTEMSGSRVFFAETARDTDTGVQPTLSGVELFAVLRSRLSPEKLAYRFGLPPGAALRDEGSRVMVLRGGRVLATVSAPSAFDAQGRSVPVSMSATGDRLVLSVPHRGRDVAYPVYVDPYVSLEEGAPGWHYVEGKFSETGFTEEPEPYVPLGTAWIEGPVGKEYGSFKSGRWLWTTPNGEAITQASYSYSEVFTPLPEPKQFPFFAVIGAWCGRAEAYFQEAEGTLTETVPRKSGEECTAASDEAYFNYRSFGNVSEYVGKAALVLLFVAEGSLPPGGGYGGGNPGAPKKVGVNCGGPVDCATGNQFVTDTDMSVPGRGPGLNLSRTYNSQLAVKVASPGTFGYGWSSTYTAHLAIKEKGNNDIATVYQGNGSTVSFEMNPFEKWVPSGPWVQATLAKKEGVYVYTLPNQSTLRFNSEGKLASEVDRDGNTVTLVYNKAGQLEKAEDAEGRAITFAYNEEGQVKEAKGPAGTVSYAYTAGNLTKATDLNGHEWKFGYDSSHQLTSLTDPRNHKTNTEYDVSNRVISQTDPMERTRKWKYESTKKGTEEFLETTVTEPKGSVDVETFNGAGQPVSITHALGTPAQAITSYIYDPSYNLATVIDPNGHKTKYEHDSEDNVTNEVDALEHKTEWTYDSKHDMTSMTDPLGNITKIEYTEAGDPTTVTRTLAETGEHQVVAYSRGDPTHPGDVTAITDPNAHQTKLSYGPYGDVVKVTDPLGHITTYEYNTAGRLIAAVSPLGNAPGGKPAAYMTKYTYDSLGQLLSVTDPMGHKTGFEYDGDGNQIHATDPAGHATTYVYDADNELERTERPGGTTLKQTYSPDGALLTQTNGAGNATTYTYNALDHLETMADPDQRKTGFVFDGLGNLLSKTDSQHRTTTYGYDADNRLTSIAYSDGKTPNVSYQYNSNGERTQMKDGTGISTYAYDSLGRLLTATDGNSNQVGYGYDLANHLTGVTYPGKHKVTREYDEAGRVTAIEDWKSNRTTMKYDANSNLATEILPASAGVVDTTRYDPDNNPESIIDQKNSTKLATYLYTRDSNEQLTSTTTSQIGEEPQSYVYTELGQLKLAGPKPVQAKYAYNAADDPTSIGSNSTLAYDPAEQLCWTQAKIIPKAPCNAPPANSTSYGYDQDGNRTSQGKGATLVSLVYDQANRLVKYNGKATYAYNGDGLRLNATIGKNSEHHVWDNSSPVVHILEDATNKYIYSPDGTPLEQIANSGEAVTYLHHDQLGNTRLLTNASGETAGTYSYTPYGTPTHTGTATTPLQYTGHYTDPESGFVYLNARYYDPTTGQFINRDPLVTLTEEPYTYAGDNPVNYTDPTGLASVFGIEIPSLEQVATRDIAYFDGLTKPFFGGTAALRAALGINGGLNTCSSEYETAHSIGGGAFVAAIAVITDGEGEDVPVSEESPSGGGELEFPTNRGQTGHIFRKADNHLPEDTPANRELLMKTAENPENYVGPRPGGNELYAQRQSDGTEVWVEVQGGKIQNGGVNDAPKYH